MALLLFGKAGYLLLPVATVPKVSWNQQVEEFEVGQPISFCDYQHANHLDTYRKQKFAQPGLMHMVMTVAYEKQCAYQAHFAFWSQYAEGWCLKHIPVILTFVSFGCLCITCYSDNRTKLTKHECVLEVGFMLGLVLWGTKFSTESFVFQLLPNIISTACVHYFLCAFLMYHIHENKEYLNALLHTWPVLPWSFLYGSGWDWWIMDDECKLFLVLMLWWIYSYKSSDKEKRDLIL